MAEFCERKSYRKTSRGLQFEKKRKLFDEFLRFKKEAKKPKVPSGLSFEVGMLRTFLQFSFLFQINIEEDEKVKKPKDLIVPVSKKVKKSETRKEIIPKSFVDHVVTLGFKENDANVLFDNKDDWMGISTGKLVF